MDSQLEAYFRSLDQIGSGAEALAGPLRENVSTPEDFRPKAIGAERLRPEGSGLPPVPVSYDVGRETWTLLEDYNIEHDGSRLTARKDFTFDLSSIPRAFWIFIAPNELSIVAPLFHDLLYRFRGHLPDGDVVPHRVFNRKQVDEMFLDLMTQEGVALWRRSVAYRAVRVFGGVVWST